MEAEAGSWFSQYGHPIWFIEGAATDTLVNPIVYPNVFRITPLPSLVLVASFTAFIAQIVAPKMKQLYINTGHASVVSGGIPTYIIAEDLSWADLMVAYEESVFPLIGLKVVGVDRPSPTATDYSSDIEAASAAGARLVTQIFSAVDGATFIKDYGTLQPNFACVGINPDTDEESFWSSVGGLCQYQSDLAAGGTQTGLTDAQSMNPSAKPLTSVGFWKLWESIYGTSPLYTALGPWDTIMSLNQTAYDPISSGQPSAGKGWSVYTNQILSSGGSNKTAVIKWINDTQSLGVTDGFAWKLTQLNGRYYRSGTVGLFSYTDGPAPASVFGGGHDVYTTPYSFKPISDEVVRGVMSEWVAGQMEIVYPRDMLVSYKWVLPSWMGAVEQDFAGGTPITTNVPNPATPGQNYTIPTPSGVVSTGDLATVQSVWYQVPPWYLLEADMAPQNHFIDIYDVASVAKAWGLKSTPS
jgi:hypothetical protein